MSIKTEIDRIKQSKADIISALETKGVTVPSDASIDDLSALVEAIEVSSSEDLSSELSTQETLLNNQINKINNAINALKGKAAGGGGETSEYTMVDYIQFSGTQWVDTGIIGNQDTQICTAFTWENSTQRHLFGCASSDNTKSITSYMNGSWRFGNKTATKSPGNKNPKIPYGVLVNKTTIGISNSVTTISGVNDFETVGTLLIGGARDSDGTQPSVGITGKIFYFYVWQGEEQVLKLLPAVNKDGEYGFLDDISGTFLTSITSTALGGGNL